MYDPEQITFFAKTDARGQEVPFGIKANDRTRHVYVVGKTGMGKSTLLENMAVQDIKNGNGLAFIDPHGQTAETLLDYIPEERKDDVVYFAPFDTANPISFNVMEDVGADQRHLVVSGLMSVFKKIWVDAWSARMEYILSNTLLALLEYPDSTLLGVNRMLSDKDYRMRVIENITDPAVKSFWVDEFLKYNERYMQEAGDAIKNKIGQFTSNPLIRNIIGQPHSSFDIRKIMDDKKILIMNLSKGLVGDQNANLLGSMLTTRIYLAAMSRANLNAEEMKAAPNFYFYVDEFQSFANATFADILSEARKYKLNLTIAHQYIEQMEEEVRNAVFGNVGTVISFRVGPFDAEVLETVFTPKFLAPDIVNLGFAQIYLTLMIDGIGSQPFSATTLPPIEVTGASFKGMVIDRSRTLYSEKREGVEETIHAWHAKSFSNKPPYVPKHLREAADGGTLPNTGENLKKYGVDGQPDKKGGQSTAGGTPSKSAYVKDGKSAKAEPKKSFQKRESTQTGSAESRRYTRPDTPNRRSEERPQSRNTTTERSVARKDVRTLPEEKKSKSLDDLRAVLKNISGDESGQAKNSKKDNEKTTEEHVEKNDKEGKQKASLKSVLASALAREVSSGQEERGVAKVNTQTRSVHKSVSKEESAEKPLIEKNAVTQLDTHKKDDQSHKQKETFSNSGNDQSRKKQHDYKKQSDTQTFRKREAISKINTEVAPVVSDQQEYAQMKNIDDPLSPKKLERMMRVTTSDKPPIK